MELARDRDDEADQQRIVGQMETRFPHSDWLAEALYSSGNMYLLKHDYPNAVTYYSYLAREFPHLQIRVRGALAGRLDELPRRPICGGGQVVRRPDPALSGCAGDGERALLAGTALRDDGSLSLAGGGQLPRHHSRLPALFLRADGACAADGAGQAGAGSRACFGSLSAHAGAQAGGYVSG